MPGVRQVAIHLNHVILSVALLAVGVGPRVRRPFLRQPSLHQLPPTAYVARRFFLKGAAGCLSAISLQMWPQIDNGGRNKSTRVDETPWTALYFTKRAS